MGHRQRGRRFGAPPNTSPPLRQRNAADTLVALPPGEADAHVAVLPQRGGVERQPVAATQVQILAPAQQYMPAHGISDPQQLQIGMKLTVLPQACRCVRSARTASCTRAFGLHRSPLAQPVGKSGQFYLLPTRSSTAISARQLHVLLRREGWPINHKRVYRLYTEEGLALRRRRPKRHRSAVVRQPAPAATRPNERWAMDFMHDSLTRPPSRSRSS